MFLKGKMMDHTLSDYLRDYDIEIKVDSIEEQVPLDMFGGDFVGQCQPLFRWVGGKTQLLKPLQFYAPKKFGTYYEPFFGGGAFLFSLMPHSACINDINSMLINLYWDVKVNYLELLARLKALSLLPDTEQVYLEIRQLFNAYLLAGDNCPDLSALFFYLNSRCFNGVYRVNSKGEFNVSYGHDTRPIYYESSLSNVHDYLENNNITFMTGDFAECTVSAKTGDFVYFDPPYVPVSESKNFTSYSKEKFDMFDQERLANEFRRLSNLGVKCMLSNSDSEYVRDLYSSYKIKELNVSYCVQPNSDDIHRSELLIMNY